MRSYGTLLLTQSPLQTFTEPLTLAEVKKHLELPERSPVDDAEDAMLEAFITGAREQAELCQQDKDLVPKQYDLYLDYFPAEIELSRKPLVSVDLIRYRDSEGNYTTLVENTHYIVDLQRALIMPPYGQSWPPFTEWPSSAVLVRFTAGYGADDVFWSDAGARIKIGMRYLISQWFSGRLPFETGGQVIAEYPDTLTACLSGGVVPRVR